MRDSCTSDDDLAFIVETFDSTIPFLDSIGSADQWGTILFSQRVEFSQDTLKDLQDSVSNSQTGDLVADGLRIFIVERECSEEQTDQYLPFNNGARSFLRVDASGRRFLPVGFAYVREDWVPSYVRAQSHLPIPTTDKNRFDYLEVIITRSSVPASLRRGAGAALIHQLEAYSRQKLKQQLWVDSWAGNERRLVRSVLETIAPSIFDVFDVLTYDLDTMNRSGFKL